jgi:hypothetical protein
VKMSMTRPRTGQKIIRAKGFVGHCWRNASASNAKLLLKLVGLSDMTSVVNSTRIAVEKG